MRRGREGTRVGWGLTACRLNGKALPEVEMMARQLPDVAEAMRGLEGGVRELLRIEDQWRPRHEAGLEACTAREELAARGLLDWKQRKLAEVDAEAQRELKAFAALAKERLGLGELPQVPMGTGTPPPPQ